MHYLDHAATTDLRPEAAEEWLRVAGETGNASSTHAAGQRARRILEESRERIAGVLDAEPIEIVLTKALACWLPVTHMILPALPILAVTAAIAGLERLAIPALLGLLSTSAFMAVLSITASAQREREGTAKAQATAWIFGWLFIPVLPYLPASSGSFWGDLLLELKELCKLVSPSSPLTIAFDHGWRSGSPTMPLEARMALMIGLQAVGGLVLLVYASTYLKTRERNPNWTDPTRGHRPACGEDPIYWREYELPMRKGGASLLVIRLRYLVILIRALLMNLLMLLANLLTLAIPIGLVVATIYYGGAAFRELWQFGYGGNGPNSARDQFHYMILGATAMLALFPTAGLISTIVDRIALERSKKTWDIFLTTPLEGRDILESKARVAASGIWQAAWPVPILWVLGIACGVISPIGAIFAGLDLLIVSWGSVALGLFLGIRPGSPGAAASRASLTTMLFILLHATLLAALLASPGWIARVASLGHYAVAGVLISGSAVMILTGLAAYSYTRRTLDRFDEWVGRPVRPQEPAPTVHPAAEAPQA